MHLAWGSESEDVRLWQLGVLLRELEQFSEDSFPVVLCGDLNSRPDGELYNRLVSAGFRSAYHGLEADLATTSSASSCKGTGFAETIDYCWLRPGVHGCASDCSADSAAEASADAMILQRLRLPSKIALRELLGGTPVSDAIGIIPPVPTLFASGGWPSDHLPVGVDVVLA